MSPSVWLGCDICSLCHQIKVPGHGISELSGCCWALLSNSPYMLCFSPMCHLLLKTSPVSAIVFVFVVLHRCIPYMVGLLLPFSQFYFLRSFVSNTTYPAVSVKICFWVSRHAIASFPGPAQLSVTCSMESWVGPQNKARCEAGNETKRAIYRGYARIMSCH